MSDLTPKGHILIVDDDEAIVSIASNVLLQAGYVTLPAYSGEQAMEVYATNKVDVVLTDVRMDGMDGFELTKRLKLVDQSLNIIVMTSYDSYDTVLTALQCGAYDYLQKPLDNHDVLTAAVNRAYSSSKLQRENTNLLLQLENNHEKLSKANRRLVDANYKLKRLASTDTLTLLYNRRYFDQVLKRESDRRNRYKLPLSVVMLDIDDFKQINDQYGHEAGDNAIKQVAVILDECARAADIVARYGGEEFVALLPQTTPENANIFAERTRAAIEQARFKLSDDIRVNLTASLGIAGAQATDGAVGPQKMLSAADKALYVAKQNGKNCSVSAFDLDDSDENPQKAA